MTAQVTSNSVFKAFRISQIFDKFETPFLRVRKDQIEKERNLRGNLKGGG